MHSSTRVPLPLFAVLHLLVVVALPSTLSFVQQFDRLHQVALKGGERRADGGCTEAVGKQAEVGEASLDARLQAGGGSTGTERGAVLGHEVHKLFTDFPEKKQDQASVSSTHFSVHRHKHQTHSCTYTFLTYTWHFNKCRTFVKMFFMNLLFLYAFTPLHLYLKYG